MFLIIMLHVVVVLLRCEAGMAEVLAKLSGSPEACPLSYFSHTSTNKHAQCKTVSQLS